MTNDKWLGCPLWLKHFLGVESMNYFSAAVSLLQRKRHLVSVAALVITLTGVAAQSRARLVSGQGQDRAGAQLQAAVSANSEAELQRVENSFPGTDEARWRVSCAGI